MIDADPPLATSPFHILALWLLLATTVSAAQPAPTVASRLQFRDGDRVVLVGNTLVERAQRYGHLETALLARLAPLKLTVRNLGWSGDTVFAESRGIFDPPAKGYQRMLDHVERLKPTVLILGYGSNESFGGARELPRFLEQYRKLIADLSARSPAGVRVVILSIPPQQRPGLRRLNTAQLSVKINNTPVDSARFSGPHLESPTARNRQIDHYNTALSDFARKHHHTLLDLNAPFQRLFDERLGAFRLDFTVDGRALNSTGYQVLAAGVLDQLHPLGSLDVQLRDNQPPRVTGPLAVPGAKHRDGRLVLSARPGRFVLRVNGLPRGRYMLKINKDDYGKVSAGDLAAGIAPSLSSPPAGLAELRRAVIAKNRLYFHRWRPQNTTYLFGFRKHEQGNNAKEVAQFEKLVAAAETRIDRKKGQVLHRITIESAR